jgi:hypothetical protein
MEQYASFLPVKNAGFEFSPELLSMEPATYNQKFSNMRDCRGWVHGHRKGFRFFDGMILSFLHAGIHEAMLGLQTMF